MVACALPNAREALGAKLAQAGVKITVSQNRFRASVSVFNDMDDIDRLLSALGDRLPSEEALPVSLALSYPEFQKSWEDSSRAGNGAAANRSSARP